MAQTMQSSFQKILSPEETLQWIGQPQQGFILRRSDWLFIPLSLILGGLAISMEGWIIYWIFRVLAVGDSNLGNEIMLILVILALICLPIVLLGLFLIFGRFFFDRARRKKTWYAFTQQRVLIGSSMLKNRVRSYKLDKKLQLRLTNHPNGRGTLYFNADVFLWWVLVGPPWWIPFWPDVEVYQPPCWERIENASAIWEWLKEGLEK